MIARKILEDAAQELEHFGIPSARLDAEVLLAFCLQCDRIEFLKNPDLPVSDEQFAGFRQLMERRRRWEPVAYLTGRKAFWSFILEVNPNVLIPRPDTEIIVEETLLLCKKMNRSSLKILDVGTGSGAIVIALASELPDAAFVATDITQAALKTAQKNAARLGFEKRISFRKGDLFEPVRGHFDIIVSNPPYIAQKEYDNLPAGVKDYEPPEALLAGPSGLDFHEKIIQQAPGFLQKNGWLLLEIGAKQEDDVRGLLAGTEQYDRVATRLDYAGLPRVIKARRS
jgi:release factor glutamine methyltransferase